EAALALHYLEGFEARFRQAVDTSEAFLTALAGHSGFGVQRISPGSNIAIASIPAADPTAYQTKLKSKGIAIGLPRAAKTAGCIELPLTTNETLTRRSPDELARAFVEAAAG